MKTTMILNDALIKRALALTGLTEKTAVVHAGLQALIARESARRLAKLGGTMPDLTLAPRRRSAPNLPSSTRRGPGR
jgi:Arc/MetJ family transcription regulator